MVNFNASGSLFLYKKKCRLQDTILVWIKRLQVDLWRIIDSIKLDYRGSVIFEIFFKKVIETLFRFYSCVPPYRREEQV